MEVGVGAGWLVLWSKDRLKEARERGWVGRPLPALFGGPHVSHPSLLSHRVAGGASCSLCAWTPGG